MTSSRKRLIIVISGALCIIAAGVTAAFFITANGRVAVDTASIQAPLIGLTSTVPGRLDAIYVHTGDTVAANQPVASVGTQVITSKVAGLIVSVSDTVGAPVGAGTPIVTMIDPTQLRVVGRIDETKGLAEIRVGNPVTFTVDAFGGKEFTGVIDEIAPTSNQSGIVFNISSQRQIQQFDIKARYDTSAYPELKNGMSARLWVRTN
ncbi:MAG: efflux RND transporter periplasmic adaptor subunit [Candidatus Pacebacteria bacterium]|nr:efflux RND transporter periplasmic adaptor subunit [Candidatus Paceibacterota bacterium]